MKNHNLKLKITFFLLIFFGVFFFAKSSLAANWYVDKDATGPNNGTSWTNAWHAFGHVVWGVGGVTAGDTLYISGGASGSRKIYTERWNIGASGSAGNYITIALDATNASHNGTVVFDYDAYGDTCGAIGGIDFGSYSYVRMNGNVGGARHISIRNLRDTSERLNGPAIYGNVAHHIIIEYIEILNSNNGIDFNQQSGDNFDIRYNYIQVRGDYGVKIFTGTGAFDANLIHHNTIEVLFNSVPSGNAGPDGIQAGSSMSVYKNTFKVTKTTVTTSGQHPDCTQITGNYVKIYNNEFINVGDSHIDFDFNTNPTPHDIYIFNNVFRMTEVIDTYPEYIRIYDNSGNVTSLTNIGIYNNTFIDNDYWDGFAIGTFLANPITTGMEIKNNIFYNIKTTPTETANITVGTAGWQPTVIFSNNIYFPNGTAGIIAVNNTSYSVASWISGHEPSAKSTAPTFVSYVEDGVNVDLHLAAADTVAKDAGVDLSSLCSKVPQLCYDKDGIARPQGSAWDIGAYEYVQAGDTTPPSAPTRVAII